MNRADERWSGGELPDAADLLATARLVLQREVVPALDGEPRLQALMIANALGIAIRATQHAEAVAAAAAALARIDAPWSLCARIRRGEFDPGAADHDALRDRLERLSAARASVSGAPKG